MGTTRAAPLAGVYQKVTLGATSKILGGGKYSISGMTRNTMETSEFGDDVDVFEFTNANSGTITLEDVTYDPTDPEQNTLRACLQNKTKLIYSETSGIRFWLDSTSYMTIGTSGSILIVQAGKVEADRSGIAKTSFQGQVSGAFMMIV